MVKYNAVADADDAKTFVGAHPRPLYVLTLFSKVIYFEKNLGQSGKVGKPRMRRTMASLSLMSHVHNVFQKHTNFSRRMKFSFMIKL